MFEDKRVPFTCIVDSFYLSVFISSLQYSASVECILWTMRSLCCVYKSQTNRSDFMFFSGHSLYGFIARPFVFSLVFAFGTAIKLTLTWDRNQENIRFFSSSSFLRATKTRQWQSIIWHQKNIQPTVFFSGKFQYRNAL